MILTYHIWRILGILRISQHLEPVTTLYGCFKKSPNSDNYDMKLYVIRQQIVGLLSTQKKKRCGLLRISSINFEAPVTVCHRRQTDPQNLWKRIPQLLKLQSQKNNKTQAVFQMRRQAGHFLIKRYRLRGSEGCRVIKAKGSCGSDSLWGQRSAAEVYEPGRAICATSSVHARTLHLKGPVRTISVIYWQKWNGMFVAGVLFTSRCSALFPHDTRTDKPNIFA